MFSCYTSHRRVIQKAYEHLRPGGWIEYQDFMWNVDSDDESHRGTALHQWGHLANAGAAATGRDFECARKYSDYLRAAGFVDVVERRLQLPGNPWPRDPVARQIGSYIEISGAEVVDAISAKLLGPAGLGLPPAVLDPIVAQAARDVHNRDIHFYWPGYGFLGRSPVRGRRTDGLPQVHCLRPQALRAREGIPGVDLKDGAMRPGHTWPDGELCAEDHAINSHPSMAMSPVPRSLFMLRLRYPSASEAR